MAIEFKVGDRVKLKTDSGPVMVISEIEGIILTCVWFNPKSESGAFERVDEKFPAHVLEISNVY